MPRTRSVTDEAIIARYQELKAAGKVAKELGIGEATARRVLAKHGVERTGLTEYRATMGRPKTEPYVGVYNGSKEEIKQLYEAGMSMRAIAARIGRSTRVVHKIISEAGLSRSYHGSGENHSQWTGGPIGDGNGYLKVWVSENDPLATMRDFQGYIKQHRYVMGQQLGRPLLNTEEVHHKNGDRTDNSPDNLELWYVSQPKGQRVSDRLKHTLEFLEGQPDLTPELREALAKYRALAENTE